MSTTRTRNYATIVYPESAPLDWLDILCSFCVPALVSPLHDLDVNPHGELKKPHYHVLLMFDSVKTPNQAHELFSQIGGVGVELVNSIRGYARYLCHLDNPEKHQYDKGFVQCFFGADYDNVISLASDKYRAVREMVCWCKDNNVVHYVDLFDYAMLNREDWYRCLCDSCTIVIKEYLKSADYKFKQGS